MTRATCASTPTSDATAANAVGRCAFWPSHPPTAEDERAGGQRLGAGVGASPARGWRPPPCRCSRAGFAASTLALMSSQGGGEGPTDIGSWKPTTPEPIPQSRRAAILIRLALWLAFSVAFGSAPLIVDGVKSGMSPHGLDFDDVLGHGHGGLFILGAVIAGGSIGELIAAFLARDFSGKSTPFKLVAILAGVVTLLMVVANTAGYMTDAVPRTVRDASEWFFGCCVAT